MGSHAYDTVCWLLGDRAIRVLSHADNLTGEKPLLGAINLHEALEAGRQPSAGATVAPTTPDYASIAWEFGGGAVGVLVVSHATYLRKGLAPELELHGTDGSLSLNRVTGDALWCKPDGTIEPVANVPDQGFGNRFAQHVFPVVRQVMSGQKPAEHPNLQDGWQVQCFTDAAMHSAATGQWVAVDR